jgi:hypothetical protein
MTFQRLTLSMMSFADAVQNERFRVVVVGGEVVVSRRDEALDAGEDSAADRTT